MKIEPVNPGELMNEEFLLPHKITKYRLTKENGVPAKCIVTTKNCITHMIWIIGITRTPSS